MMATTVTTTPAVTMTASAKAITEPVAQVLPKPPGTSAEEDAAAFGFDNPASYPPGYQVLLLQPNATETKQAGYQTTDANPNLLTPVHRRKS